MVTPPLATLFDVLADARHVLILTHNDPDPDSIASALALRFLLQSCLPVEVSIVYRGIIGRAENKVLVAYLGHPLRLLEDGDWLTSQAVALVDTQPGAGNNVLPLDITPAVVIDHHPWREASAAAAYADVRPNWGSTSTILTEYLQEVELEPPAPLATALFYGIKTDTMGLIRGTGPLDPATFCYLQSRVDMEALSRIELAQLPVEYYRSVDAALRAARIHDGVLTAFVGPMDYPDLTAEVADFLLRLRETRWVICIGQYNNSLILSVRTHEKTGGAGLLVQQVVGNRGTAGGHGFMAGGNVPLHGEDPGQLARDLVQRALQILDVDPNGPEWPLI
jgi:nanoRNase/pAp phosphatase (c-di-AMP/oligoRNAs hydrolase)